MVVETLSSPHRRSQTASTQPPPFKKYSSRDDTSSWSVLFERHRFLLTMLVLLTFLCTIYLYFAVTFGATNSCSGLSGQEKALCEAKLSVSHAGRLKV